MRSVGIRQAKAHFSELARAAADGERIVITHNGEPLAVITSIEEGTAGHTDALFGRLEIQGGPSRHSPSY